MAAEEGHAHALPQARGLAPGIVQDLKLLQAQLLLGQADRVRLQRLPLPQQLITLGRTQ